MVVVERHALQGDGRHGGGIDGKPPERAVAVQYPGVNLRCPVRPHKQKIGSFQHPVLATRQVVTPDLAAWIVGQNAWQEFHGMM